jgi:hypothetical protein
MQGKYIELESEKEVEKFISFGCVIVDPVVKAEEVEEEKAEEVEVETPKGELKSAPEGRIGNHPGGRKRK